MHRARALRVFDPRGRFNVGAGLDRPDGYIHCDPRPLPGIAVVCEAWELSRFARDAEQIYCRHMLEHLTLAEVRLTLNDWFNALRVGGTLDIIVPHLDYHIAQWARASWTTESLADPKNDARYSLAGFYGWQNECDPSTNPHYRPTYWDVHKCGFNQPLITLLLEEAGFSDVTTCVVDEVHLRAQAKKSVQKGERQVAPTRAGIRTDHLARYQFAAARLSGRTAVLDAACGIGYGSQMIAEQHPHSRVRAFDRDPATLAYARTHYARPNIEYVAVDLEAWSPTEAGFDAVVSFETIEHLQTAPTFLRAIWQSLQPNGLLVCSTPDQTTNPFDPVRFPFHVRHYTSVELTELLRLAGFAHIELFAQFRYGDVGIHPHGRGDFLVAVAQKSS